MPRGVAPRGTVGVASTVAGTDTYRRSHSCNHRKRSCQGRGQPGPEGDLQRDIPLALGAEAEHHGGQRRDTGAIPANSHSHTHPFLPCVPRGHLAPCPP